jgi:integrase
MPRRSAGPRLYLDPGRDQWAVRDGQRFVRTGCAASDTAGAEKFLAEYIARKHKPKPGPDPLIVDVLNAYATEHAPHTRSVATIVHTVGNLAKWWNDKRWSGINARNCRAYAKDRPQSAARRDLETLRAATRHWKREHGQNLTVPSVVLPKKEDPRERWLTRSEAARLLWAARRVEHLKRFILIGLYTGSRSGAILALRWDWVDLEHGIMRRRGAGETETNKRRPPVRLGARILHHLRRWRRNDGRGHDHVVSYEGRRVTKLRRSWAGAVRRAGLDTGVTPHTLRHTRATWLMRNGADMWKAAGALGMSVKTLERTYGHHHPDFQAEVADL